MDMVLHSIMLDHCSTFINLGLCHCVCDLRHIYKLRLLKVNLNSYVKKK